MSLLVRKKAESMLALLVKVWLSFLWCIGISAMLCCAPRKPSYVPSEAILTLGFGKSDYWQYCDLSEFPSDIICTTWGANNGKIIKKEKYIIIYGPFSTSGPIKIKTNGVYSDPFWFELSDGTIIVPDSEYKTALKAHEELGPLRRSRSERK